VRVFTRKLATNWLAVQVNRSRRLPNTEWKKRVDTMLSWTARLQKRWDKKLRSSKVWNLPPRRKLAHTGNEWVYRTNWMMGWKRKWRSCGGELGIIVHSVRFLQKYFESIQEIPNGATDEDRKGKKPQLEIQSNSGCNVQSNRLIAEETSPRMGWN
jgi:hypothetical protein